MEDEKIVDQSLLASDVAGMIPYEFMDHFLVKPLDPVKVKKEFSKPVSKGSTKDADGIEAQDFDEVETEVKEVDSDYRKGVVIKRPMYYEKSEKTDHIEINVGDVVRVDVLIKEGDKERIQAFEGTVIAKKNGGVSETFTVRRVSYGVGVERVFPIHSPHVSAVHIVRRGKVRRAKLYYLRNRVGKAARVKQRI